MSRSLKYLTPTDSGWWFRITRGGKNIVSQTFRYSEYGTPSKTLSAAQDFRDDYLEQNPKTYTLKAKARRTPNKNGSTKTPGVSRRERPLRSGGVAIEYIASWDESVFDEHGKEMRVKRGRTFRVSQKTWSTEEKAYDAARKHRKKMEKKHYKGWI